MKSNVANPHPDIYLRAAEKLGIACGCEFDHRGRAIRRHGRQGCEMRVAAIPDIRFVRSAEYEKEADYVLGSLSEIPTLVRTVALVINGTMTRFSSSRSLPKPLARLAGQEPCVSSRTFSRMH